MLALFSMQATGYNVAYTLAMMATMKDGWDKMPEFTVQLCHAVEDHSEEVDATIASLLEHWKPERVAAVERVLLRLACAEIDHFPDIPPRVTVNEYIELAKQYGSDQSPAFINGIVDRLMHQRGKTDFQAGRTVKRAGQDE